MKKFTQEIYKVGINPVVDPPDDVLITLFEQAGRSKGPIPVCGRINGEPFIQTLVKYQGKWRLYINGPMLKVAHLKVGDTTAIEIEYDPRLREVSMPEKLAMALKDNPVARSEFDKLSPSRRKEIVRYITSLRSDDAVERNVRRVIGHLLGTKQPTLNALMRKK